MLTLGVNGNTIHNGTNSNIPRDYGQWAGRTTRVLPTTFFAPQQPNMHAFFVPNQIPSMRTLVMPSNSKSSFTPAIASTRMNESRSRSITPDIVIERRHRRHCPHHHHRCETSTRDRTIQIPLDSHSTFDFHRSPKRILELERVRCRRQRKHHKSCDEMDYKIVNHAGFPVLTNPAPWILNLSQQMIENLPKETVFLPPILLPGSQTDAGTELNTVLLPTTATNPINGTQSIVQSSSAKNTLQQEHIPVIQTRHTRVPLTNILNHAKPSPTQSTIAAGPFMRQIQEFLQRLPISSSKSTQLQKNPLDYSVENNPASNSLIISSNNITDVGPYSLANIRTPNNKSNNLSALTPSYSNDIIRYPPANITAYQPPTNLHSSLATSLSYEHANITPYYPTNNLPTNSVNYPPANITPYQLKNNLISHSSCSLANMTSHPSTNFAAYQSSSVRPSNNVDFGQYPPANITPYKPTNSIESNLSYSEPFASSNITPYKSISSTSAGNSLLRPSIPSTSIPSISAPPAIPSDALNSNPITVLNNSINTSSSLRSLSLPPQSTAPMPKSILRNATTSNFSTAANSDLNSSIISLPSNGIRKTAFL